MPIQVPVNHQIIPNILERIALSGPRQKRSAGFLLPLYEADVSRESYKVALFDESSLEIQNFEREYGGVAKRLDAKPRATSEIKVTRYTIEASVDRAETHGSSNIIQSSLLIREERLRHAYNKLMSSIEAKQVEEILSSNNYNTNIFIPEEGFKWSDSSSSPVEEILIAKKKIKESIGFNPNTMVISEPVWSALRSKQNLLDLLPNTTLRSGLNPEDLGHILGIEKIIIADGMFHNGENLQYSWGNNSVLAYVPKSLFTLDEPSFGITIRSPLGYHAMREYFDEKTTSDITAIDEKLGWAVTNYNAGYLFSDLL